MPQYLVEDSDGMKLSVSGDNPPSEGELKEIFTQARIKKIKPTPTQVQEMAAGSSGAREDYSIAVAPSLNPNYEFAKETQGGAPGVLAAIGQAILKPVGEITAQAMTGIKRGTAAETSILTRQKPDIAEISPKEPLGGQLPLSAPENKGVIASLSRAVDALRTPENIGAIAASSVFPTAISSAFSSQIPVASQEAVQSLFAEGATPAEKRGAVTDLLLLEMMRRGTSAKEKTTPSLTPLTDQALKGEPNAIQERSATPVPLEAPPGSSQKVGEGTPAPETPALPQGQEKVVSAAINVGGRVVEAPTHVEAYEKAKDTGTPDTSGAKEGFVTDSGKFITREEAAKMSELPTETETGKLHSSDLLKAQEAMPEGAAVGTSEKPIVGTQPPSATGELVGMGGAVPSEFSGASSIGREVYGIAERVRNLRAAAGEVEEIPPGEGILPPDSVERGRELLKSGANPEAIMSSFEENKRMSSDDMAIARAQGEKLAQEAHQTEIKYGTDSDEYRAAFKKASEWEARSKAMQTEWSKTGMAQQGATDIDTGTFTGLQMAHVENTGREFNPKQAKTAKTIASDVSEAQVAADESRKKLSDALRTEHEDVEDYGAIHPKIIEAAKKIVAQLDERASAARQRLREKLSRASAGVDPTIVLDVAEIGLAHIAHGIVDFAEWSAKVVEDMGDLGESIKPYLEEAFKRSNEMFEKEYSDISKPEKKAVRERKTNRSEKRLFEKANREVRKAAKDLADAENKRRIAKTEKEREESKAQEIAAQKALNAANRTVREAAIRAAKKESAQRVLKAEERPEDVQAKAAQDALEKANEEARKAAIRLADAENKSREEAATRKKLANKVQEAAARKALAKAQKAVRDASLKAAEAARKALANPEKPVWDAVRKYLESGETSFDDIRNKVATDLGMSVSKVTGVLTRNPRLKTLADDAWKKQQDLRRFKNTAKRWLYNQSIPKWQRAVESVPRALFSLKVGFHGTVALGTHAPTVAFQPMFWKTYITDFGKMYRMVADPKYYEMQVQDLLRRKNYVTARRAGLVNDPYEYEDFNSPQTSASFGKLTGMGNRGYSVLKILRQDMFDHHWENLPKTAKIPEVAKALADGINHATGVVKSAAPKGASTLFFAPRLELSRLAWLFGDPIRASRTFLSWKNAPIEERIFAVNQAKEKAWVFGTYASLLALNQGFLTATGSDQKINWTDPMKSDFLKFKAAGMNVSYGNAMVAMARMPARLYEGVKNEGKLNKIVYEDENTAKIMFDYGRSQLSPFAGLVADLGLGRDFQERPLPRAGFGLLPGKTNVPKRLRAQGVQPYTWSEYLSTALPPIPFVEPVREVWKVGLGMSEEQFKAYFKAMAVTAFDAGTGGRATEDYDVNQ